MNDHLGALLGQQHDDLEHVGGAGWPDDELPIGVLAEVFERQRVVDGMEHLFVSDAVAPGRGMDLHTEAS
jgi:hypothetical protein